MTKSTQLLNAVQRLMIDFANDNGICLRDEFGTVDNFKQFVISFTFKQLTEMGVEVKDAFNMVMGDGRYDELVDTVWNAAQ